MTTTAVTAPIPRRGLAHALGKRQLHHYPETWPRLGRNDAAVDALRQSLQAARGRGAAYEVELTERVADDSLLDLGRLRGS